jgi:hypothetical protein
VVFHEACALDATAVATVQAQVRQRVLRAFVCHGLLAQSDGDEMGGWAHGGGFSLDAAVRIEGADRAAARYLWAVLLARIYEVFPLTCPFCSAEMRIIAFITEPSTVRQMLNHLGAPTRPPRFAPARGPPLWETAAAASPAGNDPHWDEVAQPPPESEFDQRLTW